MTMKKDNQIKINKDEQIAFKPSFNIINFVICLVMWASPAFMFWLLFKIGFEMSTSFIFFAIFTIHILLFQIAWTVYSIYYFGTSYVVDAQGIKEFRFKKPKRVILKEDLYGTIVRRDKGRVGRNRKSYVPITVLFFVPKKEKGSDEPLLSYDFENLSVRSSFFDLAKKDRRIIFFDPPSKEVFQFITKTLTPVFRCYDNDDFFKNII